VQDENNSSHEVLVICPSTVAQFLAPRASKLHSIQSGIAVDDQDDLFCAVLEALQLIRRPVQLPRRSALLCEIPSFIRKHSAAVRTAKHTISSGRRTSAGIAGGAIKSGDLHNATEKTVHSSNILLLNALFLQGDGHARDDLARLLTNFCGSSLTRINI
jgi:hypothetical protein